MLLELYLLMRWMEPFSFLISPYINRYVSLIAKIWQDSVEIDSKNKWLGIFTCWIYENHINDCLQ